MNIGRHLRVAAALAVLVGGLVHLQLYFEGYRAIDKIGRSFLLNAVASAVVAVALAVRPEWFVRLAGIALAAGTIGAFIISRRGDGLFDFRETGLEPSPQAIIALVAEIAAVILLAATFLPGVTDDAAPSPPALLLASTAVSAIAMIGLGVYWAGRYDTVTTATDNGVQIADFAFGPANLTVDSGTTVRWTNADAADHSVVATDVSFLSENLGQGETFDHTFDDPGEFTYVCGIHSRMTGSITVTG